MDGISSGWSFLRRGAPARGLLWLALLSGASLLGCSPPEPGEAHAGGQPPGEALGQREAAVLPTTITLDVAAADRPIPREIFGNNVAWTSFDSHYASSTSLPSHMLNEFRALGVPSLRYPGGCGSDGFTWETSIGPKTSRGAQLSTMSCGGATLAGRAHFGVDEFLQLAETLGAEPQLTLQFRPFDKTPRAQAESSHTVVYNAPPNTIYVSDFNLDNGTHVSFQDVGDSIDLSFSVPRAGYYRLHLRNRAGYPADTMAYWNGGSYSYAVDGASVTFTGDAGTLSAADIDGYTVWGTTRSQVLYLREGAHKLRLTANAAYLKVDLLDVQELNHDNSVKRAKAWLAYVNGDPADTRPIGVDQAGINWQTVGYWASLRGNPSYGNHPAPYGVKFWEVGNEAWGVDPFGVPRDGANAPDPAGYAAAFLDYKNALFSIDSNLRLSASSTAPESQSSPGNWMATTVQQLGDDAKMIHYHPYYPWDRWSTDPAVLYRNGITAHVGLQTSLDQYRSLINTYHPSLQGKLKLSASEWAAAYGWDNNMQRSYAVRWTGVMTVADELGTMGKNTDLLENAQYWLLWAGDVCVFEGGTGVNAPNGYFRHGIFEALQTYNHHWGDRNIPVTVAGSSTYYFPGHGSVMPAGNYPHLAAYGSLDSKRYYLLVLNKDESNARAATVQLGNLPAATHRVQVRTIKANAAAPTYSAIDSAAADVITTSVSSLTPFRPAFDYTFPASSITVFVIDRAPAANLTRLREVEDVATTVKDTGAQISTYDWSHDSGSHMSLNEVGDELLVPFNVTERAYYVLELRHRSGSSGDNASYWTGNAYAYTLDGAALAFAGDSGSFSPVDVDGFTVWGTSRSGAVLLNPGRHALRIRMNGTYGKVDSLRVVQDKTRVFEAESSYTVVTNTSGAVGVSGLNLDSGNNVNFHAGDKVKLTFSVPRSGSYALALRQRTGIAPSTTSQAAYYTYKVDTTAVTGTVDASTVSQPDADGYTVWGTVTFPVLSLAAGSHSLEVTLTGSSYGKLDYLSVETQVP